MYQPKGTKCAHIKLQPTVDTGINCLTPCLSAQHSLQEIPDLNDYLYFACSWWQLLLMFGFVNIRLCIGYSWLPAPYHYKAWCWLTWSCRQIY